jgi:hypothetical protein
MKTGVLSFNGKNVDRRQAELCLAAGLRVFSMMF